MVIEAGAIVDNSWAVLGELKDLSFGASLIWAKGNKDLRVTVKLEDLSMFEFKETEKSSQSCLEARDSKTEIFVLISKVEKGLSQDTGLPHQNLNLILMF